MSALASLSKSSAILFRIASILMVSLADALAQRDEVIAQLRDQLQSLQLKLHNAHSQPPLYTSIPGGLDFQHQHSEPPSTPPRNRQQDWTAGPPQQQQPAPGLGQAQYGHWQASPHAHARGGDNLAAGIIARGGNALRVPPAAIVRAADAPFVTPRIADTPAGLAEFQRRMPGEAVSRLMVPQMLSGPAVPSHRSAVVPHQARVAPPRSFFGGLFDCFGRFSSVAPM